MEIEILDVNTIFGSYPSQHADSTPESLVRDLDKQFVQWCLALSTTGMFYDDSSGNAETLRACQQYPHLIPAATFNPMKAWKNESLLGDLEHSHFELVRFFPHEQGWPIRYLPFREFIGTLSRTKRTPVMISVASPGDVTDVVSEFEQYPHPVVLEGVSGDLLSEAVSALRQHPNFFVETHALKGPGTLEFLKDRGVIDRVLFGSATPGWSLAAALRFVKRSSLSDDEKLAVLGGNAQRIWQSTEGA